MSGSLDRRSEMSAFSRLFCGIHISQTGGGHAAFMLQSYGGSHPCDLAYGRTYCRHRAFGCRAHIRFGSNPDRRASLLYVPDSAVALGRALGAGARGRRRRVGATDIQQRMPNLPYDQGRRQSPGSEPTQHHWKESRLAAELRLFQRDEGRGLRVGYGKARQLIAKPDEVVPGNNMKPYGGLASAEDRTKLIAFLQSLTTD